MSRSPSALSRSTGGQPPEKYSCLRSLSSSAELARPVEAPELAGERASASVELKRHLARLEPEQGRGGRVEDLVHLLELDEVVALADRAEPDPRDLLHRPRKLAPHAIDPAIAVDVETAALLHAVELGGVDAVPVHGEAGPLGRAADHLFLGQVRPVAGRIRVALAHTVVEVRDGGDRGPLHIERD